MSQPQHMQLIIQPDAGAAPEVGPALWSLEDTRRRTHAVLKAVDPASVDWQPEWALHSIGTLLYHIAAIELDWLYSDVLEQPFPAEIEALFPHDVRDDTGKLTTITGISLDDLRQRLAVVRRALLDAFHAMSADDFHRSRSFPDYDVTPEWVLHHLCQHEAEHRSEIAALQTQFKFLARG
ncbi:MAG: DUF664 domain-containing protein [Chloroflexi bacterium]|nr:DUF664 domain-containing protein [Chloroflexota bacterium]